MEKALTAEAEGDGIARLRAALAEYDHAKASGWYFNVITHDFAKAIREYLGGLDALVAARQTGMSNSSIHNDEKSNTNEPRYTAGCTHPDFAKWWTEFGEHLVGRLTVEMIALAAWGAADWRAKEFLKASLPSPPPDEAPAKPDVEELRDLRNWIAAQTNLPAEFRKVVDERFWDLLDVAAPPEDQTR